MLIFSFYYFCRKIKERAMFVAYVTLSVCPRDDTESY